MDTLHELRLSIGAERGLPDVLSDRLRGDTREEIEADADSIAAVLPRPLSVDEAIRKAFWDSRNGQRDRYRRIFLADN